MGTVEQTDISKREQTQIDRAAAFAWQHSVIRQSFEREDVEQELTLAVLSRGEEYVSSAIKEALDRLFQEAKEAITGGECWDGEEHVDEDTGLILASSRKGRDPRLQEANMDAARALMEACGY